MKYLKINALLIKYMQKSNFENKKFQLKPFLFTTHLQ